MTHHLALFFCLAAAFLACEAAYTVRIQRLSTSPVLSSTNSPFDYNYNSAYLPLVGGSVDGIPIQCLAVRVQNFVGAVVPSKIAIFCEDSNTQTFSREPYVVIDPSQSPAQADGCEDPRVQLLPDNKTLLMFYTAVNTIPNGARAKLSLASCNTAKDPHCRNWTLHGALFPNIFWSKSGALMVRHEAPHFLLWGDTNISIASTTDFYSYTNTNQTIIGTRDGYFDSALVESGPPPLRLSDGKYIFLYNSARVANRPSPKQGWDLEYNVGYAIINGSLSPSSGLPTVVQRSDRPVMSPVLGWETCNDESMVSGLTPNVVFVNGATSLDTPDTFLIYYQGCDARTGIALLTVRM